MVESLPPITTGKSLGRPVSIEALELTIPNNVVDGTISGHNWMGR